MKTNTFLCGCLTTLAVVLVAEFILHNCNRETIIQEQTSIETFNDTVSKFIGSPIPVDSTVIRYITVKVPVPDTIPSRIVAENIVKTDTFPTTDSVSVTLPITQKIYQDSTYKAWVSGYHPSLDSIVLYQPITTITKTITKTDVVYKPKKWGVGIQVGMGITQNKIEPYIGIGVTYNIFSW